ncbi:MAG: LacI family transcriptional regulator, partial [Kiritimatiellaceae bacterium]|nr:LacI family transcriptional regulator [Kiritimatiellaceae bacterium]
PSAAALTLKGKSSRTIGVVVYDFRDPFFGTIIEKLQEQAHEQGYSLVLAGFKGRHPAESDLAPLRKHAIDGLIVIGSAPRSEWMDTFRQMPVARIGHGSPEEASLQICVDESDAARQLLEHLISKGRKKVAFVGANLLSHSMRFHALEKTGREFGVKVDNHLWMADGFEAGLQGTKNLLADDISGLALICATDAIAMGALHALHDAGVHIPVTGFDDIPAAEQFIPPITTIRQPVEEMAKLAFRSVVEQGEPSEILLKGKLLVRSSS